VTVMGLSCAYIRRKPFEDEHSPCCGHGRSCRLRARC
jgi:hypothetical protein